MTMPDDIQKLFGLALEAQKRAFAPLSKYYVGCAVLTEKGNTYIGCNVESATYTNSTHAEMLAIDSAVLAGEKKIARLLIVTSGEEPGFPCALCRQKIAEFSDDAEVIAATPTGEWKQSLISELYPDAFTLKKLRL